MTTKKTPSIPLDIVEYLERIYHKEISEIKTMEDLRFYQGQLQVIQHLRQTFSNQQRSKEKPNVL